MNKVLYYSPVPDDNTAFYRSHGVLPYLSSSEYELIDISHVKHFTWATFAGAKVLILQRPTEEVFYGVVVLAKQMGFKVILDYDDDVLNVDKHNPTYVYHSAKKETIKKIIGAADEIWVTTEAIKQSFNHLNTHIIPNALNDYIFNKPRSFNHESKICVWRGSSTHEADLYQVAQELISVINHRTDWKFYFIGHQFTYLEQRCGDNYFRVEPMATMDYFKFLYELNPNIMICPLIDSPINRSKSNISWLEASYVGACYFGNDKLPEFKNENIADIKAFLGHSLDNLDLDTCDNNVHYSWEYISDNLALSTINQLRNERIIANL